MGETVIGRERRRAARRVPHPLGPLSRVRVRAGRELTVVNISSGGVLVEGEARLLPGTHLEVHVVIVTGRTLVRSRVLRAYVADLSSDRVIYRAALGFEQNVDVNGGVDGNWMPDAPRDAPPAMGTSYPAHAP